MMAEAKTESKAEQERQGRENMEQEGREREEKGQEKDRRLAELEAKLAEQEEKLAEYVSRIQRLQADFENYKKRVAREWAARERAIEDRVILEFIPIYDNLERAFRNFRHNNDKGSFIEGIEHIFSQFAHVLEKLGVQQIEALGQRFDPAFHEALLTVEGDGEPNVVLEEFERGYLREGRVLRPSRVKVSKPKGKGAARAMADSRAQAQAADAADSPEEG